MVARDVARPCIVGDLVAEDEVGPPPLARPEKQGQEVDQLRLVPVWRRPRLRRGQTAAPIQTEQVVVQKGNDRSVGLVSPTIENPLLISILAAVAPSSTVARNIEASLYAKDPPLIKGPRRRPLAALIDRRNKTRTKELGPLG